VLNMTKGNAATLGRPERANLEPTERVNQILADAIDDCIRGTADEVQRRDACNALCRLLDSLLTTELGWALSARLDGILCPIVQASRWPTCRSQKMKAVGDVPWTTPAVCTSGRPGAIPDSSNFHAAIRTKSSPARIAKLLP
jgi:hypothetical protein